MSRNSENRVPGRSWLRCLGAAAVVSASLAASTGAAYGDVLTSNRYLIGSAATVVDVAASCSSAVEGQAGGLFSVSFVSTTAALEAANGGYIQLGDSDGNDIVDTASSATVTDQSPSKTFTSQTLPMSSGSISLDGTSGQIQPGDRVQVQFTATNPSAAGPYSLFVATSAAPVPAASPPLAFTPPAGSPAAFVQEQGFGYTNALYTLDNVDLGGTAGATTNTISILATLAPAQASIGWDPSPSAWAISYSPTAGSIVTVPASAATVGNSEVTLTLSSALTAGQVVTITGYGTNPCAVTSPCPGEQAAIQVTPGFTGAQAIVVGTVQYGSSVSHVTAVPSRDQGFASATYMFAFTGTSAVGVGGTITAAFPKGTAFNYAGATSAAVSNVTQGTVQDISAPGANLVINGGEVQLTTSIPILVGDHVSVTLTNVANPAGPGIFSLSVATSSDTLPASSSPYLIGFPAPASQVSITVSPPTPGALATYTLSGFEAGPGGLSAGAGTLILQAGGTTLPNDPSDYSITDSTTSGGSGTATQVGGGGTAGATVKITVPNNIAAGDNLTLTVNDVVNPTGGSYSATLEGNIQPTISPLSPFPDANVTYPDGAIVDFGGPIYVFAGGHGFAVPSPAALTALRTVDKARVVNAPAGVPVPTAAASDGTTITAYGHIAIYVVVGGELYGFASPGQFLSDGYDPADVITVPSLGGMVVSPTSAGAEGSAATALATAANGAIVSSGGTYYVFAGGRAFGVPTVASLLSVQAADKVRSLAGLVAPALVGSPIADGTLVTVEGAVYVSYGGTLFAFKSLAQLDADGYGGTPSMALPNIGGLSIQVAYSGS